MTGGKMKKIEKLFTTGNFDSKNITNKCNRAIDPGLLETIETSGATFELLEGIGAPVYKYRTQITIHGLFPELKNNRIGGYYNVFQNKNKSIGVKYTAIDREKKRRIFAILRRLYKWNIINNSSDYFAAYYSDRFTSKEKYLELLPEFKKRAEKIDKSLFFGSAGVELVQTMYGYYLRVVLDIGAIAEKNVDPLLISVTGENEKTGIAKIEEMDLQEKKERAAADAERDRAAAELAEKMKPYFEHGRAALAAAGWQRRENIELSDGLVTAAVIVDRETMKISYKFTKFSKNARQKKFRFVTGSADVCDVAAVAWDTYERQTYKTSLKAAWMRPVAPKKAARVAAAGSARASGVVSGVQLIDYSDRAVAVIGNTKPIKDILKAAGGRFNFRLKCGAGWIFPKTQKEDVKKLITA